MLLRLLARGASEKIADDRAKRALQKKLGRQVNSYELSSLGAYMDAADIDSAAPSDPQAATTSPPPKPMSKTARRVWAAIGLFIVLSIVFGVVSIAFLMLPEKTRNALNPFSPKLPLGAFPATIAGYRHDGEVYYIDWRGSGGGYKFSTVYKSPDGKVGYEIIDYGSPEKAKQAVQVRAFTGSGGRVLKQTADRGAAFDPYNGGIIVADAFGKRVVRLTSTRAEDVIALEKNLPYAAFGVSAPAQHTVSELGDIPILATSLIDQFKLHRTEAVAKYAGKTLLFADSVATVSKSNSGAPMVVFQKTGARPSLDTVIGATFRESERGKVTEFKHGTEINFRCRVDFVDMVNVAMLEDCVLENR